MDKRHGATAEVGGRQSRQAETGSTPPANGTHNPGRASFGEPEDHRNVEPKARHMNAIDLLTYVVSSTRRTLNFALILFASAIIVGAFAYEIAPHLEFAFTAKLTKAGMTVGLTSAGTVAVAALAETARVLVAMIRRRRRARRLNRDNRSAQPPNRRNG